MRWRGEVGIRKERFAFPLYCRFPAHSRDGRTSATSGQVASIANPFALRNLLERFWVRRESDKNPGYNPSFTCLIWSMTPSMVNNESAHAVNISVKSRSSLIMKASAQLLLLASAWKPPWHGETLVTRLLHIMLQLWSVSRDSHLQV